MKTKTFRLPNAIAVEADHLDPNRTKLLDAETGQEIDLPVTALQFTIVAGEANRLHIELGDIAMKAAAHDVFYEIAKDELAALARQNGFRIEAVPAYPARISNHGPTELQVTFRDLPGMDPVINRNIRRREAIEQAEKDLHRWLDQFDVVPPPSEPEEGEILIWAHGPAE